ncbi:MAG: hypothetical protein ACI4UC_01800, partial [Alloprevotella sp.]
MPTQLGSKDNHSLILQQIFVGCFLLSMEKLHISFFRHRSCGQALWQKGPALYLDNISPRYFINAFVAAPNSGLAHGLSDRRRAGHEPLLFS